MKRQFSDQAGTVHTFAALGGDSWLVTNDDGEHTLEGRVRRCPDGTILVEQGGITRPAQVSRSGDTVWLTTAHGTTRWIRYEQRRGATAETCNGVTSPMTGKIVVVNVAVGQSVTKGDVLVVVEAMKMEQPLKAPRDGVVAVVSCEAGQLVDGGVELVALAPEADAEDTP